MPTTFLTAATVASAASFLSSLGVNTHFPFNNYGYQNLTVSAQAINYLGLKNLRDSGTSSTDVATFQQVVAATGAKFDDFMPEGSPSLCQQSLAVVPAMVNAGVLNYVEGGNEEDDSYAIQQGNSLTWTAQFQQQVWSTGQSLGLPVINMSFGAGWTYVNNWQGDYGSVGDLSAFTNYGNAHTYPQPGQDTDSVIQRLNGLAQMAALSRPVMTTEIGWDENQGFAQSDIAKFAIQAAFDAWKDGDVKTYYYALFNDGAGKFGLMNQDGSAKPVGTAIHNLTTLMADSGSSAASYTPQAFTYALSGTQSGDNTLIFGMSDGSYWVSLWNETQTNGATHSVTLTLPAAATQVAVYDPLVGTSASLTQSNASSVAVTVPDHPVLVHVVLGTSTASSGGSGSTSTGSTSTGSTGSTSTGSTGSTSTGTSGGTTTSSTGSTSTGSTGTGSTSTGSTSTGSTGSTVTATSGSFTSYASNTTIDAISATTGLYVWGTGDTIVGSSGPITIQAFKGNNTIQGGSGATTMTYGGTNNKILVGSGATTLNDSASSSTITFGAPGGGNTDIYGYIMSQNETLDFSQLLAGTKWSGNSATVGSFLLVTDSNGNTIVQVNPSGVAGGTTYPVATLHGYAYLTLSDVLQHAVLGSGATSTATGSTSSGTTTTSSGSTSGSTSTGSTSTGSTSTGSTSTGSTSTGSTSTGSTSTGSTSTGSTSTGSTSTGSTSTGSTSTGSTGTGSTGSTTTTASGPVTSFLSNTTIEAGLGTTSLSVYGTDDIIVGNAGPLAIQALKGSNTIEVGNGATTVTSGGTNNKILIGSGTTTLNDSGSSGTITFGAPGGGNTDIYGYILSQNETLDFSQLLAGTKWNGDAATVGNYLLVSNAGGNTIVQVNPSGVAGDATYPVATLHGYAYLNLAGVLQHASL